MGSINGFIDSVRAELKLSGQLNKSTKKAKDAFGFFFRNELLFNL